MKNMIFLGGTCGNNHWRDGFSANLVCRGVPGERIFNPIVKVWDDEAKRREASVKKNARFLVYYLGDPRENSNRRSFYSLFETMLGLYDDPDRTVAVFDVKDMPMDARESVYQAYIEAKARFPNAPIFDNLREAEDWITAEFKVVPFRAVSTEIPA